MDNTEIEQILSSCKLAELPDGMRQRVLASAHEELRRSRGFSAFFNSDIVNWAMVYAYAAVVVLVLSAGAGLFYARICQRAAEIEQWAALCAWQASTDVLLTRASTPWGSTLTLPTDSLFENGSSVSETSQINRKEML